MIIINIYVYDCYYFCDANVLYDLNFELPNKLVLYRTIPASLKEIRPAVSEIQMLTDRPMDRPTDEK